MYAACLENFPKSVGLGSAPELQILYQILYIHIKYKNLIK